MEKEKDKDLTTQIQALQDALSAGLHVGCGCGARPDDIDRRNRHNIFDLLLKLGLKTPPERGYGHLAMADLSATFKQVSFDMSSLKSWGSLDPGGKKK